MLVEVGPNLFHAAILFIVVWGIVRFFGILGKVAEGTQRRIKPPVKPIEFTR